MSRSLPVEFERSAARNATIAVLTYDTGVRSSGDSFNGIIGKSRKERRWKTIEFSKNNGSLSLTAEK